MSDLRSSLLPAAHVPRPRLVDTIPSDVPVVCVVAGAGWGKSVLLREFAEHQAEAGVHVSWIGLAEDVGGPTTLWAQLVDRIAPDIPVVRAALEAFAAADPTGPVTVAGVEGAVLVDLLLEHLAAPNLQQPSQQPSHQPSQHAVARERRCIVVDDLHLASEGASRHLLARFVEGLPSGVQVCVASRHEPPLPLAAWRLDDRVVEVRTDDLRLRSDEVAALLSGLGVTSGDDGRAVTEATEGWPVGVVGHALARRSARGSDHLVGTSNEIHPAPGPERLFEEVLDSLHPELAEFVRLTSVLPVLDEHRCGSLTGRADSGDLLRRLERFGVFTIPLDATRRTFRYHHLFRETVLERFRSDRPDRWADAQRRASAIALSRRDVLGAVDHLLDVGDVEDAFRTLTEHHADLMASDDWIALRQRLARIPDAFARTSPERALDLCVLAASASQFTAALHSLESLRSLCERGEAQLSPAAASRAAWSELLLSCVSGRYDAIDDLAARCASRPIDPMTALFWRELPIALVFADRYDRLDGTIADGETAGIPGLANPLIHAGTRAVVAAWRGRITDAKQLVDEAWLLHGDALRSHPTNYIRVPHSTAIVEMETGDAEAAFETLAALLANRPPRIEHSTAHDVSVAVSAMRALRLAGRSDESVDAARWLPGADVPTTKPWFRSLVAEEVVRAACEIGDTAAVAAALRDVRGPLATSLARAHVALASDDLAGARAALHGWDPDELAAVAPARALDLLLLLRRSASDPGTSRDLELRAVDLASRWGLHRSLRSGSLRSGSLRFGLGASASDVRRASAGDVEWRPPDAPPAAATPMSRRELDVLRLLASARPANEIAEAIGVSANTLKTHTRAVYKKLGATGRADAVHRARLAGLLPSTGASPAEARNAASAND